jgi:alginate O-acetyltransferase complex protein AlgI
MLFNSIAFFIFLPLVFFLYWFVFNKKIQYQNVLLVLASYVFYGWWDARFLTLIVLSSILDYSLALGISKTSNISQKKILLYISLFFNLGTLIFFKYVNFFVDSWVDAWSAIGVEMDSWTINIVLPVGISFYTFQTLSYTLDVYKNQITPSRNVFAFFAYVAFFPQLVAGPIERAYRFLPQFSRQRRFNYIYASEGIKLMIWGFFKKLVIADNCAYFANQIFDNPQGYSSLELLLGMVFFSFQIYGDFSGYSYIANGLARLFGFDLMLNFKFPYLSKDIAEFWRRWHISLSSWFRDYLYIPLGGSRGSLFRKIKNVMIIFLVSGFWHGANWTFIFWGFFHGLLFLPLFLSHKNKPVLTDSFSISMLYKPLLTFFFVCVGWVFFRANTIHSAYLFLKKMFYFESLSISLFTSSSANLLIFLILVVSIVILMTFEVLWRAKRLQQPKLGMKAVFFLLLLIFMFGSYKNQIDFIYFQF